MSFIDVIRKLIGEAGHEDRDELEINVDSDGISFYKHPDELDVIGLGSGSSIASAQYVALQMLVESGDAVKQVNSYFVSSEAISGLDSEILDLLRLPPRGDFPFRVHVSGHSKHPSFRIEAFVVIDGSDYPFSRKGPILSVTSSRKITLNEAQLLALRAIDLHESMPAEDRGEDNNLRLIATLQAAKRSGLNVDLSHFDNIDVSEAARISLTISRLPDGSIELAPNLGDGSPYSKLAKCWSQLDLHADSGVIRIGNRIVLLDKDKMDAILEVFSARRIPREQVSRFMQAPTAFINAALVDLDCGFSVRVDGVGRLRHLAVGELDAKGVDWFSQNAKAEAPSVIPGMIQSKEDADRISAAVKAAWEDGADSVVLDGIEVDISDQAAVAAQIDRGRQKLFARDNNDDADPRSQEKRQTVSVLVKDAEDQREELLALADQAHPSRAPDWDLLKRTPFPHQEKGIDWLTGLGELAQKESPDELYRLQGCLLADDMGLGKTYMALAALSELMKKRKESGKSVKPILVVAPLSLLENWEDEVAATFHRIPFRDVIVLQGGRDLSRFRIKGTERETVQVATDGEFSIDDLRYALHVGPEAGPDRLDMDARLVLMTYQTLRDYQFSLCRIDWGAVVFDEAQNIKNPNAGVTCAAKALKADFKILATGTPVENSLLDFWCIIDTAQPGLLGDWPTFRTAYVKPILQADPEDRNEVRVRVGQALRQAVGRFMLRRTKEDELPGLPNRSIFAGAVTEATDQVSPLSALAVSMEGLQLSAYDRILDEYQAGKHSDARQGLAISSLHRLRSVSLHPKLPDADMASLGAESPEPAMAQSAKLRAVLTILKEIRARDEKVIIFLITKKMQVLLKIWLDRLYGLDVGIINGDTQAVAKKADDETRKSLIRSFEEKRGFNIMIMSPVAAGVGLTVVGANNVIHLERHWNPAKESQASDRVYRIGQTRDVKIYLPAAVHPTRDSFDVHLHRLLQNKLMLKDAVVTTEAVSESEILAGVGLD